MKLPASKLDVKTMSVLLGAGRAGLGLGYMFAPNLTTRAHGQRSRTPGSETDQQDVRCP